MNTKSIKEYLCEAIINKVIVIDKIINCEAALRLKKQIPVVRKGIPAVFDENKVAVFCGLDVDTDDIDNGKIHLKFKLKDKAEVDNIWDVDLDSLTEDEILELNEKSGDRLIYTHLVVISLDINSVELQDEYNKDNSEYIDDAVDNSVGKIFRYIQDTFVVLDAIEICDELEKNIGEAPDEQLSIDDTEGVGDFVDKNGNTVPFEKDPIKTSNKLSKENKNIAFITAVMLILAFILLVVVFFEIGVLCSLIVGSAIALVCGAKTIYENILVKDKLK